MSAEIICVGTELLLGDILNSNARFLAGELASLGIPHYFQTVVGDNPQRIQQVLQVARDRGSQLLIFTGGLGPTPDDLTHETLAQFFGVSLVEKPEILEDIAAKYAARGRKMASSNRKQASIPDGADILPNRAGTAPGIIWQPEPGLTLLTFPGVPGEMHRMWQETAVPYLKGRGWGREIIYSRVLKFWGISESELAEKVSHFFEQSHPTVAPYASNGEVKLRLSARARSPQEAQTAIAPVIEQIKAIAGSDCFGSDEDTLASVVGRLLLESGQTIAVAESCTGGGLGQLITAVAGSSSYFMGGVISYDNQVKIALLGVDPAVLEREGAVSATVAEQMARGVRDRLGTDWGVSITGIAGPGGGSEAKPVGLVYIGLAGSDGSADSFKYQFGALRDRDLIRHFSACCALDRLRRKLLR
ncbi:competence/damage-inducible protein A [Oxynema sp. CENA135]|uniref:competence/damage-inducible protein A n=1 Tax=Oxynema sp. CENA135 TaxID=984206 RepID=UPI00190C1341|nr:competence/damage-inducible protein A [Oxynema sp. CENA135]MBK4731513.1 competence/damage-inducible protein A [Oxynema sp. CENA135]